MVESLLGANCARVLVIPCSNVCDWSAMDSSRESCSILRFAGVILLLGVLGLSPSGDGEGAGAGAGVLQMVDSARGVQGSASVWKDSSVVLAMLVPLLVPPRGDSAASGRSLKNVK